jgi:trk system potassium uptake protein TrkH
VVAVLAARASVRAGVLDLRPILLVIGVLLIILALFMAPPMVADMAAGHPDWQVFLVPPART